MLALHYQNRFIHNEVQENKCVRSSVDIVKFDFGKCLLSEPVLQGLASSCSLGASLEHQYYADRVHVCVSKLLL